MENENNEEKKAHIFEIDFLRAITVFSVVTIHSFASMSYLYSKNPQATKMIALFIHLLHYNREIFIFVTGLVLTYVYYHRPFSAVRFWSKRLLFIFVPYVLWTIIYILINNTKLPTDKYLSLFWTDLLTGNASYQLYYISLALQYYALFPFFLWFIKKVSKYPLTILIISFIIQISMIYFDFTFLQKGPLVQTSIVKNFLSPYQDRLFFSYQFFFIAG
jgi:peptidoglycan/LPS O-acetylase OafA/YrhL